MRASDFSCIRDSLKLCFEDINSLGVHHSLAACDYFDTFKRFPENGMEWTKSIVGLNENSIVPNHWSPLVKVEMEYELKNHTIVEKKYHWTEVESLYLKTHWNGYLYLSDIEFKFYMCAWIWHYPEDAQVLDILSDCFLLELQQWAEGEIKPRVEALNLNQKSLIAQFLLRICLNNFESEMAAKKCLDLGWWYLLDDESKEIYLALD